MAVDYTGHFFTFGRERSRSSRNHVQGGAKWSDPSPDLVTVNTGVNLVNGDGVNSAISPDKSANINTFKSSLGKQRLYIT